MSPLESRTHLSGNGAVGGWGEVDAMEAIPASLVTAAPPVDTGTTHPLSDVPQLSSRPNAAVKLYLEFRGGPNELGQL